MAKKLPNTTTNKPAFAVQVACLVTLIVLVFIDARYKEYTVPKEIYLIIAGILFGVADVRKIIGGGK